METTNSNGCSLVRVVCYELCRFPGTDLETLQAQDAVIRGTYRTLQRALSRYKGAFGGRAIVKREYFPRIDVTQLTVLRVAAGIPIPPRYVPSQSGRYRFRFTDRRIVENVLDGQSARQYVHMFYDVMHSWSRLTE